MSEQRAPRRVDEAGRALRGSQLQVQIYVNRRLPELEQAARSVLPTLDQRARELEWVSPLESKRFAEYQDLAFLRAVGLEQFGPALARFWPARGGPVWDGLARIQLPTGDHGVLLVEGKSYPKELYSSGCTAKAEESKRLIRSALEQTQAWLGLAVNADGWLGSLYQSGNRLAHLYFLRELVGVEAWMLHTCFTDDVAHVPIQEVEWRKAIEQADQELGLTEASPFASAAFLPARPRSDLVD